MESVFEHTSIQFHVNCGSPDLSQECLLGKRRFLSCCKMGDTVEEEQKRQVITYENGVYQGSAWVLMKCTEVPAPERVSVPWLIREDI